MGSFRRFYLHLALIAIASLVSASQLAAQAPPTYDLLLKGGHVIDPANNVDAMVDVAIAGGKIAAVGKDISVTLAKKVVDVSGLYVTPGLIDIHYHVGHGGAPLDWFTAEGRGYQQPPRIPSHSAVNSPVSPLVHAGGSPRVTFLL